MHTLKLDSHGADVKKLQKKLTELGFPVGDTLMRMVALATIRAETESFEPVPEGRSRFNTSPNGHPFDLYDQRGRALIG